MSTDKQAELYSVAVNCFKLGQQLADFRNSLMKAASINLLGLERRSSNRVISTLRTKLDAVVSQTYLVMAGLPFLLDYPKERLANALGEVGHAFETYNPGIEEHFRLLLIVEKVSEVETTFVALTSALI